MKILWCSLSILITIDIRDKLSLSFAILPVPRVFYDINYFRLLKSIYRLFTLHLKLFSYDHLDNNGLYDSHMAFDFEEVINGLEGF